MRKPGLIGRESAKILLKKLGELEQKIKKGDARTVVCFSEIETKQIEIETRQLDLDRLGKTEMTSPSKTVKRPPPDPFSCRQGEKDGEYYRRIYVLAAQKIRYSEKGILGTEGLESRRRREESKVTYYLGIMELSEYLGKFSAEEMWHQGGDRDIEKAYEWYTWGKSFLTFNTMYTTFDSDWLKEANPAVQEAFLDPENRYEIIQEALNQPPRPGEEGKTIVSQTAIDAAKAKESTPAPKPLPKLNPKGRVATITVAGEPPGKPAMRDRVRALYVPPGSNPARLTRPNQPGARLPQKQADASRLPPLGPVTTRP
jgi:hypothetical protein